MKSFCGYPEREDYLYVDLMALGRYTMLRAHLLGGFDVWAGDVGLPTIPSRMARSLYAYLLVHRDRPHTRSFLAGLFWPEESEENARRRLSQALWHIRRAFTSLAIPHPCLHTDNQLVQCNPEIPCWIDVEAFEELLDKAREESQSLSSVAAHLKKAIRLYRGDFMAGHYQEWILVEQDRLRDRQLKALNRLVSVYKAQGEYEEALLHALQLTRLDPLREDAHQEAMRMQYLLGRPREALQQYALYCNLLNEEFGKAEPDSSTTALYEEIRAALQPGAHQSTTVLPAASSSRVRGHTEAPLVGRREERSALIRAMEEMLMGRGGLVLLEGEAGVGKTRLLKEIQGDARWRGIQVIESCARASEILTPYSALRRALAGGLSPLRVGQLVKLVGDVWLGEASRLLLPIENGLPDYHAPTSLAMGEDEAHRLIESCSRVLLALGQIAPHLLILDDMHWADEGVWEVLRHLFPRLSDSRLLVILSFRGDEARSREAVWRVLRELDQAGVRLRLSLPHLTAAETSELVQQELGLARSAPRFEERLYRECGGNPLFVLETLRVLQDQQLLYHDDAGFWSTPWDEETEDYSELPLAPALHQVIKARLAQLNPASVAVMNAAVVLCDDIDFHLLHQVADLDLSDVLSAVEDLVRRGLLVEAENCYQFNHDKICQVAYEEIPSPQKRRLHRRAGKALEETHPEEVTALARHFTHGQVWDRAVIYHRAAAEQASAMYAFSTAKQHCDFALDILEDYTPFPSQTDAEMRYDLLMIRQHIHWVDGSVEQRAADLEEARRLADALNDPSRLVESIDLQADCLCNQDEYIRAGQYATTALALARKHGLLQQSARALRRLGQTLELQDRYAEAEEALLESLSILEGLDDSATSRARVEVHILLSQIYRKRGLLNQAEEQCLIARDLALTLDDSYFLMNICNLLSTIAYIRGDHHASIEHLQDGLVYARATGFLQREAILLSNLGIEYWSLHDYDRAITCTRQGLEVYRQLSDRRNIGIALDNLGHLYRETGRLAEARAAFEEGLQIAAELAQPYMSAVLLCDLAWLFLDTSDLVGVERVLQEAGQAIQEITAPYPRGIYLLCRGRLAYKRAQITEAVDYFEEALHTFTAADEADWTPVTRSYLAIGHLALGKMEEAARLSSEAVADMEANPGGEEIQTIYWHHRQIMLATGNEAEADEMLERAAKIVQTRRSSLPDRAWQRDFIEQVAVNREIMAVYRRRHASQLTVRLPRVDAPAGRPLRDEEWMTVTWTVHAPEDERFPAGKLRRQHRLLRLLKEAAAQDAAPTVESLATALGVSAKTIKRDLANLRSQGHAVHTRGSRYR